MTEPPQDGDRRPEPDAPQPDAPQPSGQAAQQYGLQPSEHQPWGQAPQPPQQYGAPQQSYGQAPASQPQSFNRPYGQPPAAPVQYGPPGRYGPPPADAGQPYGPGYGQPPYGQPAHGQPAKKSRVRLIAVVTAVLLVLIAGGVVLALTLGKTLLSRIAVQRDVAAQFEKLDGVGIDLDCPRDMEVKDGATYDCSGTTDDGEKITLRITIEDAKGARYTWTEV